MTATTAKRSYDSSRRARQAAETRAEVLQAAIALFAERGWAGTTLAAVAEQAGVSVETIYKGFGSKKGLLREAMDVALVGDTEPLALADRPEFEQLGEGTLDERIAHAARMVADQHSRTAGVWLATVEAAGADDEMAELRTELEHRRRLDVGRGLERALGLRPDAQTIDLIWLLYSSDAYRKLIGDLGYTRRRYEALMADATARILADHL